MRPQLVLKPMEPGDESTVRIYGLVDATVKSFNVYVADFFESVSILEEQQKQAIQSGKKNEADEIEGKISYMRGRINELNSAMKKISEEMHSLIELHHSA